MNNFAKKKFIIILGVVLILVILISIIFTRKSTVPIPTTTPTPTTSIPTIIVPTNIVVTNIVTAKPTIVITIDTKTPQEGVDYYSIDPQEEKKLVQVGKLLEVVPFQGTNFSIRYDIDLNKYIVTIPSDKKSEGEQELDIFLKQKGIQSRDLIHNLVIEYR